jgi:putative transcriptional regulator
MNYKSEMSETIHELASALYRAGGMEKKTMKEFDESCLVSVKEFTAQDIKALREKEGLSQSVFARYFSLSSDYISKCERGEKRPDKCFMKLLTLAEKNGIEYIA